MTTTQSPTQAPIRQGDRLYSAYYSNSTGNLTILTHTVTKIVQDTNGWIGFITTISPDHGGNINNLIDNIRFENNTYLSPGTLKSHYYRQPKLAVHAAYLRALNRLTEINRQHQSMIMRIHDIRRYANDHNLTLPDQSLDFFPTIKKV